MDSTAIIQRSTIWFVLRVVVLGIAIIAVTRLLERTNDDRDPTIVGALVLQKPGNLLAATPLFTYVGDVGTKSAVIGIGLQSGPKPSTVRILISNVRDRHCEPQPGISVVNGPTVIGKDTAFYSFHQAHVREITMIDVIIEANARVSISCNTTDPPERETYTTRRVAFAPPTNEDILSIARADGYEPSGQSWRTYNALRNPPNLGRAVVNRFTTTQSAH